MSEHPTPPAGANPKPRPIPRRMPTLGPKPTPVVPASENAKRAVQFGRVDEDGTVYVREAAGERVVGQVPGKSGSEALDLYVRRYLDLDSRASLLEIRIASADVKISQVETALTALNTESEQPAAVGDLDGLRTRLQRLAELLDTRKQAVQAERAAARADAVAQRTILIEQAEAIAAGDPHTIHWKHSSDELRGLLDKWRVAQRSGPRLDKSTEDELWHRFSAARSTFERLRREHFALVDSQASEAKRIKEGLVSQAEQLSSSTDWNATANAFRALLADWKQAGRAGRRDDDELWARFKAASDTFFGARSSAFAANDAEYQANLEAKTALAEQAEALLPISDLEAARNALGKIQEQWAEIGRVPREALNHIEGRLRSVEHTIRDAESAHWRAHDPEKQARANSLLTQLEATIKQLEDELANAQAAGNADKISAAQEALQTRRAWLEQVRSATDAGL